MGGGTGGIDCPTGQTCANSGSGVRCVTQCDPLHQDCPDEGGGEVQAQTEVGPLR